MFHRVLILAPHTDDGELGCGGTIAKLVESGEEALDQFSAHRDAIGCVVLDLTMPGMDGKETFKRLREASPQLPIIIASGLSADQVASQFSSDPETAVIQKPYQVADLSATIQNILGQ